MNLRRKAIKIHSVINSVNPFNWIRVGKQLKKRKTGYHCCPVLASLYGTRFRNDTKKGTKK